MYNSKIYHEQGGSVLVVGSGGSLNIEAGGVLTIGSAQIMWAASTTGPAGGPVNALPGSIFIRSDGSVTGLYVNVGVNGAGSVWASACLNLP